MNYKKCRRRTSWHSAKYKSSAPVVAAAYHAVMWTVEEHERVALDGAVYSDGGFELASVSIGRSKLSDIYHYTTGKYL